VARADAQHPRLKAGAGPGSPPELLDGTPQDEEVCFLRHWDQSRPFSSDDDSRDVRTSQPVGGAMVALYVQGRMNLSQLVFDFPDLLLGVLFLIAFVWVKPQ
jgi:hypothetical protein